MLGTLLARRTGATVVAYERAGFGRSELGPPDLTPREQVDHLAAALARLGTPAERILVGHSYGGLMALLHADAFATDVVGLVLVDPMNPRFVDATGDFVRSTVPRIETPKDDAIRAIARMARTFDALADAVRRTEPAVRAPIVVITAGEAWWRREDADRAWRASHEAIAAAAPGRRLVVADRADHDIPEERPDVVLDAVLSLLDRPSR